MRSMHEAGQAIARATPFLTGFLDAKADALWRRPACIPSRPDGALIVTRGGQLAEEPHWGIRHLKE